MKHFALVDWAGNVCTVVSPGRDDLYEDGGLYGSHIAREIPWSADVNEVMRRWYWHASQGWKVRPAQPGEYYFWDAVDEAWQANLGEAIDARKKEVDQRLRELRIAPLEVDGVLYDADFTSQEALRNWAISLQAGLGLPPGFVWRDAHNTPREVDDTFIFRFLGLIALRETSLRKAAWAHKTAIGLLSGLDEILSYDISRGW